MEYQYTISYETKFKNYEVTFNLDEKIPDLQPQDVIKLVKFVILKQNAILPPLKIINATITCETSWIDHQVEELFKVLRDEYK